MRSPRSSLAPGPNVFVGRNGQGKTNLAEAIAFLATLGSHRVSGRPADGARRRGCRDHPRAARPRRPRACSLEVQLNRQGANKARVNGAPVKPAELPRYAQVVLFAPEDLQIVRGEPSSRRRFARSAARPAHAAARRRARRLRAGAQAAHRPAEVREGARASAATALSTLDIWDDKLVALGSEVIEAAPRARRRARRAARRTRTPRSPAPIIDPETRLGAVGATAPIPNEGGAIGDRPTDAAPAGIADLFREALAARRVGRTRPRAHARRPAPRRPRAAGARPAGQGVRVSRRIVVGRARAAARLGRAAARGIPARRPRADPRRRVRRARPDRRARLADAGRRVRAGASSRPPCRRTCPRALRARIVRIEAGTHPGGGGCLMPATRRGPTPPQRARDRRDLSAAARPGAVGARVPQAPAPRTRTTRTQPFTPGRDPTRRRRRARGPHPRGGLGHAARARGRGARHGPRSPVKRPLGTPGRWRSRRARCTVQLRLDGVGEAAPADARAHPLARSSEVPRCGGRDDPLHRAGRPLLEMGSQNDSRAWSARYLRLRHVRYRPDTISVRQTGRRALATRR